MLPPTPAWIAAAGLSDTGPVRTVNEDHWMVDPSRGLFVVADGMGGHQAGEVASRMAVAELAADLAASAAADFAWPLGRVEGPGSRARLRHALLRANDAVCAAGAADPALVGMGTTLTALLLEPGRATIGSVGDSRAYLVRGDTVDQITHDDTWLASVLGRDEARAAAARAHPMRHVLTSVIGTRVGGEPEVVAIETAPGDIFVLASDGLHNVIDDARIAARVRGVSPADAAARLVRDAIDAGTTDNVTVVVVHQG